MSEREDRADRILDAAGELLLRMGIRKVTIEDIARQAGIGKGTVYLHWRTKDLLFQALLMRESIALLDELLDAIAEDPMELMPHRFIPASFAASSSRPLIMAVVTGDFELIGAMKFGTMARQNMITSEHFYELMFRHGLLRRDIPDLAYAVQATVTGYYTLGTVLSDDQEIKLRRKAELLAYTIRQSFEPAEPPSREALTVAATEVTTEVRELMAHYRQWIYADPAQRAEERSDE